MSRFAATGRVEVGNLEHSVAELPWGVLRGAFGPSDGSVGAHANVPSALSVLRHAPLYVNHPEEIEEAFAVLERHALRHRLLYPVAVTVVPFLLDFIRRGSPIAERIAELIAEYVATGDTLEPHMRDRLHEIVVAHTSEVLGWIGRFDRPLAALAIHIPALQPAYLFALETSPVSPFALLALLEIGVGPRRCVDIALEILDDKDANPITRAAGAAFLVRFGDDSTSLRERIDAALPPSAPAALANLVTRLWVPRIERPVVAPRMVAAEVLFAGERLVLVRAGAHSVTLPWRDAGVRKGDVLQVGITVHGQPKLVVFTEPTGTVRVIDFDASASAS
ncbi:MAG: hypothetical protein AB7T06_03655 [Kofleriaceae bacterium]